LLSSQVHACDHHRFTAIARENTRNTVFGNKPRKATDSAVAIR
jgi:hypothetical protein